MRFYLSSHGVGADAARLAEMAAGRTLGFVPNALDFIAPELAAESHNRALDPLRDMGIPIETLDLRDYFDDHRGLRRRLADLGGLWLRGGNTFVLREAMRRSGFDQAIAGIEDPGFLWAGYSAGICVLAPSLKGLQQVDDPSLRPYGEGDPIFEGLGLLDYLILPHYRSDHFESPKIELEVAFCEEQGIPYRTLRDGEVIILDGNASDPSGHLNG